MHLYSYLRSAGDVIKLYDGKMPFASWLKKFFNQHKKFGSKDRRAISDLSFGFYRLGSAFKEKPVEERLLTGQFLCHSNSLFIKELKPEWYEASALSLIEKIEFLNDGEQIFFPFADETSSEIEKTLFAHSHLIQPDLFLRIRPGNKEIVTQKLTAAGIEFSLNGNCIRLPNSSKIDEVLEIDKEVVIQDKSSQQVLNSFSAHWQQESFSAWDCCAASGGKTILLHDLFPTAQLTVADIRESILHNLRNRFGRAGINNYKPFVTDVSSPQFSLNKKFDVVICDAPCSGSGTWGRTPEQLTFFQKEKIGYYANLQKKIAANATAYLRANGCFVYITCSVFKKENEDVVAYLIAEKNLRLIKQEYFKGYTEKADTLFAALFTI